MAEKKVPEGKFTIINEEGKEVECDVLFTFDNDATGKSYIVYTDNTFDEEGNVSVYASTFDPTGKNEKLMPIESEKEWSMIEIILSELQDNMGEQRSSGDDTKRGDTKTDDTEPGEGDLDKEPCEETEERIQDANQPESMEASTWLAYRIRRGEAEDAEKYRLRDIFDLQKDGIQRKNTFSLINMALFCALNVGDQESWQLADQMMEMVSAEDTSSALKWWSDVAKNGETEGYLVHLWLLEHQKIQSTPLGTKEELLARVKRDILLPDFFD